MDWFTDTAKRNALLMGAASGLVICSLLAAGEKGIEAFSGILIVLGFFGLLHAVQAWRRSRLGLASAAITISATASLAFGVALTLGAASDGMLGPVWGVVALASVLGTTVLFVLEGRRSPRRWAAWQDSFYTHGLAEILLGQHFPDARHIDST